MPSSSAHLEQARHNEALLRVIPDTHPDWEITTLFYTSLHFLRAFLSTRGPRYTGDDLRYDLLVYYLTLEGETKLAESFNKLKELAHRARYECRPMSWASQQLTEAERALRFIKTRVGELGVSH